MVTRGDGLKYEEQKSPRSNEADTMPGFRKRSNNLNLDLTSMPDGYVVDERPDLQVGSITDHIMLGNISYTRIR